MTTDAVAPPTRGQRAGALARSSPAAPRETAPLPSPSRFTTAGLTMAQHGLVLCASFFLVALFTYPLILDPGHLLPRHKDPFMYAWTMVSNTHTALTSPRSIFDGNTFYPYGNTKAHTDLLFTPTLFPAAPIYLLTGNPVLQYNVTLLLWWALSGWAAYVSAFGLFGSHPGAAIAAIIFALCPFRTDFFLEFQMQLAFPIPLALLCLFRFLETGRGRYVAWIMALVWIEALASLYYGMILGCCLLGVTALHATLRPRAWSWRRCGQLLAGGLALAFALAPFIVPYAENYLELGLVRNLDQPARHSADVLTYLETGVTKLYTFRPTHHIAETSLFMGFVALGLAIVGCVSPSSARYEPLAERRRLRWLFTGAIVAVFFSLIVALIQGRALQAAGLQAVRAERFFDLILLFGLCRLCFEGWWAVRSGTGETPLGEREIRWLLLYLIAVFFVLSLGPTIYVGRVQYGPGLYGRLYPYVLPFHAMRITSRMGVIVVLGVSLLAALGTKAIVARCSSSSRRVAVPAVFSLLILAEYAPFPLPYQRIDWTRTPPVYGVLAADPDDVAVLEWPQGDEYWDDFFTFLSIHHWKRIVNGASGFSPMGPPMTLDIVHELSAPDAADSPFPTPGAVRYLLGIHPLRYVVVHNAKLREPEQRKWAKLRSEPWATYEGRFGTDDLYELTSDETGPVIEKFFSWDYARLRRAITFRAQPLGASGTGTIDVELNGRPLGRSDIGPAWTTITMPLTATLHHSAPNTLTIRWRSDSAGRGIEVRDFSLR
jgi:hypothetical protein